MARAKQVKKWEEFFRDPTFWWDNRLKNKVRKGFPDFKHVSTGEALWVESSDCPSWAASRLSLLADPAKKSCTARYKAGPPTPLPADHPVSYGSLMDSIKLSIRGKDLALGKKLHETVFTNEEHKSNLRLLTGLIDMYCKCGELEEARKIFDAMETRDSVSYNAIILGCSSNGDNELALEYFSAMKADENTRPDDRTFVAAIRACSRLAKESKRDAALRTGMEIHSKLSENQKMLDLFAATSLVDMYASFGDMGAASKVFQQMPSRDTVSWNAMIHGYVLNKDWERAISQYEAMVASAGGAAADAWTYTDVLTACGGLMAINLGKEIHELAKWRGMLKSKDPVLATSLVSFYGKCGDASAAQQAFDECGALQDTGLWNALFEAYTHQGRAAEALDLFQTMQEQGCILDNVTFICVLNACSHGGLVDKGRELLDAMAKRYRVEQRVEHYGCLIDMLGRANRLTEALEVLETMPFQADYVAWTSLLGACRKWSNHTIGKLAYERLVEMDSGEGTPFVLMSDIY